MSLHDYLTAQVHRHDPVGDLARDYTDGLRRGAHLPMATVESFRTYLEHLDAWDRVLNALELARSEMEDHR
ncbi:hypothetical protein FM106_15870 [Brachybacterium faecium]|nr:hypothetical protein FM106_15870 [Brachybacterium faecium]